MNAGVGIVTMRSEERRVGSDWSSDVCSSDLLSIGLTRKWVVNWYLRAAGGHQTTKIPRHECWRGYSDNASPTSHAGVVEAQTRKEESFVAAIVDMRSEEH